MRLGDDARSGDTAVEARGMAVEARGGTVVEARGGRAV